MLNWDGSKNMVVNPNENPKRVEVDKNIPTTQLGWTFNTTQLGKIHSWGNNTMNPHPNSH